MLVSNSAPINLETCHKLPNLRFTRTISPFLHPVKRPITFVIPLPTGADFSQISERGERRDKEGNKITERKTERKTEKRRIKDGEKRQRERKRERNRETH